MEELRIIKRTPLTFAETYEWNYKYHNTRKLIIRLSDDGYNNTEQSVLDYAGRLDITIEKGD